jgi:hypothetical protein
VYSSFCQTIGDGNGYGCTFYSISFFLPFVKHKPLCKKTKNFLIFSVKKEGIGKIFGI